MVLHFRYKDFLINIINCLVLSEVMIFPWLGKEIVVGYVLIALIIVEMLINLNYFVNTKTFMCALSVGVIYPCINFIFIGGRYSRVMGNILRILPTIFILFHLIYLFNMYYDKIIKNFHYLVAILNIYIMINIPFIIMQKNGYTELSGYVDQEYTNKFLPDLISGLFGYNGTPMMAIFVASLFSINLLYYKRFMKKNKIIFIIYNIGLFIWNCFVANISENKGMILFILLFILCFYCISNLVKVSKKKFTNYILKIIAITIILLSIVFILYITNDSVRIMFNNIISVFSVINKFEIDSTLGSAERIAYIIFFFKSNIDKLLGVGLGKYYWTQSGLFGFVHFGQSDFGVFLIIGGFAFIVLLLILFYKICWCIFKNVECCLFIIFTMILVMIFTQMVTVTSISISFGIFIMACGIDYREDRLNNYIK